MTKSMGKSLFENCVMLDSISIEGHIDEIDNDAFRRCHSLRYVSLPVSVKKIGSKAFEECTALSRIELPVTLQEIGNDAFAKCVTLQSIIIPPAVKEIGSDAFSECSLLASVQLPVALKSLGGGAFAKCVSLREVTVNAPLPPKMSRSTFKDVILQACKFYIPRGCRNLYMQDKQWQKIPNILEK
jgi:hypothetical protein